MFKTFAQNVDIKADMYLKNDLNLISIEAMKLGYKSALNTQYWKDIVIYI